MRLFARTLTVAAAVALASPLLSADHPNVLLIMTDDQGWGDISSHGNPKIDTPVMDSIAAAGVRFERFFVSPVCAPTRASLLTGRYALRSGVSGVTRGYENMRSSELTLAEALKSAGYKTGAFGKWHNGRHYPTHPNGQGFDEFHGFTGGHWQQYFDTPLDHNGTTIKTKGYITDVLTDSALGFIRENTGQPWFCYVPYNAPHSPWEVTGEAWEKYGDRGLDDRTRCVYAMVDVLDQNIGRLLAELKELELEENTIVIFLTDNGPNGNRFNGDMRGTKGSVHEGGVRVPLFIRWPGKIEPGSVIEPIAAHIDLLPTILDMAGVSKPDGPPLDGRSLWLLIQGREVAWPERMLFTGRLRDASVENPRGAVRTQRWRAVRENNSWSLFDMIGDPEQQADVSKKHPTVMASLTSAFDSWLTDATSDGLDYMPIPIGHPKRAETELPANEAFLKPDVGKGIRYIGGGTANAWIMEWTDVAAYPQWEVDVLTPGEYEVTLMYNCREGDEDVKLRAEIGGRSLEGRIKRAFYPEYEPNNDRLPKLDDHYEVKEWAPLKLGRVRLEEGRTTLTVKALNKPGAELIELRRVLVRKTLP